MRNAIISVYRKDGIVEFARELVALDWRIISSDGTARVLREAGVEVTDVADISGFPPMLGHRVVTLVPQIHGGLLATEAQREELDQLGFPWIDLACVDLYPLKEEVRRQGATRESVIEKTDIGGLALIRSAAKGRRIVIVDPEDREMVVQWLKEGESDGDVSRDMLAARAEAIAADYCLESARYLSEGAIDGVIGDEIRFCEYGENAWQTPANLFTCGTGDSLALDCFKFVEGGAPSFNNWCDVDRLLQTITHIAAAYETNGMSAPFIAVGVKHGNSCGAATADNVIEALRRMIIGDPLALFGGLVMTNFPIGEEEAVYLRRWNMTGAGKRLLDGVFAPSFSDEAKKELKRKRGKCRLLENPALASLGSDSLDSGLRFRYVRGGFLRQPNYTYVLDLNDSDIECVGTPLFSAALQDILLAWAVGSTSNSNTVTLAKDGAVIGNGTGRQDRVGAAELAVTLAERSGHDIHGAVAYSDSFFPFSDGPSVLIKAGVKAILASKGSVNDEAIRDVCRKGGVTLYLIPDQKGRGFFGH
ncbi:MAG: hypothetical protein KJI72_00050 [Patescibacteria group bacterium]|nr:hypothetical protein [Patescibacteria group bacterium]